MKAKIPPWLDVALGEFGVSEIPGPRYNSRIIEYHNATTLKATSDEVAWCSSFCCWVMEMAKVPSTRSAAARSWLNWGVSIGTPVLGCVVVLKRGADETKGHVALFLLEHRDFLFCLNGNYNNEVCISRFKKSDVLGYRMPEEEAWGSYEVG